MNASTLEVMRTPERRASTGASNAPAVASPPDSKQKVMRRPSLRTTAMDHAVTDEPQSSAGHVRRGSGASSSDSLVVGFLFLLPRHVLTFVPYLKGRSPCGLKQRDLAGER